MDKHGYGEGPREDDLTADLFDKFCKYIYDKARINLGKNKMELVRARFGKVIRKRNMSGFREYFHWMQNDTTDEALREVMNAISTNLTSFFRENEHFVFLARNVLPEMERANARREGKIRLRGWSAGCSTGEEPYSTAITIVETLARLDDWDVKILATDIDTEVVAIGQRGIYASERVRGIPPGLITKYMAKTVATTGKSAYSIRDEIRRLITFRHLNLFSHWPFRYKFNFIFCRNVMIYFDRPTQEMLVNRFYDHLAPGGYLFTGHSESLSSISHPFEYIRPTIYRHG